MSAPALLDQPHHDGSPGYLSDPAPALGDVVTVFLRAPAGRLTSVHLRSTPDGEPRFTEAVVDRTRGADRWWRAELEVRNPVTRYRWLLTEASGTGPYWLNALGPAAHDVPDRYDFRLLADDPPPAWARSAVVYQIFPDRFARSAAAFGRAVPDWAIPCDWGTPVVGRGPETPAQLYGGDLDGVVEHLDHIEALGADTVYLTPIFPSRSNHRYDATAFDAVDPLLGGDAALGRLTDALHERGMRLVGDITTNHCGDAHPWFRAAVTEPDGPERSMFYLDAQGRYESWCGVATLPKFNWGSTELRRRFFAGPHAVVGRWLDRLDGWRVDVANMTGRRGGDAYTHEVARLFRAAATAARPDALVVAEHTHDASEDLDRGGWHATMNVAGFLRPVWTWLRGPHCELPDFLGGPGGVPSRDGTTAVAAMRAFNGLVSWRTYTASWSLLGSHDSARIRTVVGDAARGEVAAGLLLTLPGTPMVFAGDEIGLTGENGEASRTPMPWGGRWDTATLAYYRRLVALRRGHPALRAGGLRWAHVDPDAIAFVRADREESLLVLARRAAGEPIRLPGLTVAGNLYGGAPAVRREGVLELPGDGPTCQVWQLA